MIEEQTFTLDEIEEQTGFDRRTIAYYVQQGLLPKVGRRGPRTRYSQLFLNRLVFIRMIRDLQDRGAMGTMTLGEFRDLFKTVPEETIADVVSRPEPPHAVDQRLPPGSTAATSSRDRKRAMVKKIEDLRRSVADEPGAAPIESQGWPMDPAQESPRQTEPADALPKRAYLPLENAPRTATERDTPSGEHHRLTVDAIERVPGAPEPARLSAPPPPVEDELREALVRLHGVLKRQPRAYLRTTETWTRARITEELTLSARGLEERHLSLLDRVAHILRNLMRDGDSGF